MISVCLNECCAKLWGDFGAALSPLLFDGELTMLSPKSVQFKAGFDVIFESVGGEMFDTVSRHVAVGGTIVVIGMMSAYKDAGGDAGGWPMSSHAGLTERLLWRGAAAKGFFLLQHAPHYRRHLAALQDAHARGELRCAVDPAEFERGAVWGPSRTRWRICRRAGVPARWRCGWQRRRQWCSRSSL